MAVFLDIISGSVVGGIFLLIAISATNMGNQELLNYNAARTAQEDLSFAARYIERDVQKMGYGIPESMLDKVLITAQSDHLKFLAHLNQSPAAYLPVPGVSTFDNVADTIEYTVTLDSVYSFADTSVAVYSVNRTIAIAGAAPVTSMVGRVAGPNIFKFQNQIGKTTANLEETRMLEVTLSGINPMVVLSPEQVFSGPVNSADAAYRKQEVRRILRGAYRKTSRFILHNLRG